MSVIGTSVLSLTVAAAGAIRANRFVGFDDAEASVAGQPVKGVAEYAATAAGQFIAATAKGTAYVISGSAVQAGDPVASDNQGRAVPAHALSVAAGATPVTSSAANGAVLTGSVAPECIAGRALKAATASGQLIELLLT